ncbi:hypothetical protein F0562_011075 [Nyssa sinensis]|nr:hypothetical protein F0562_011075 [Nyssa sinensis]
MTLTVTCDPNSTSLISMCDEEFIKLLHIQGSSFNKQYERSQNLLHIHQLKEVQIELEGYGEELGLGDQDELGLVKYLLSHAKRLPRRQRLILSSGKLLAHTMRHVAETVSTSKVAASFTHIIKSSEPAFSVLDSRFLLGETFPMSVYLSLVPIIGGFALAAVTELNLNMTGLMRDMISNLALVFRNIFSKGAMKGKSVGGMNYYAGLSMLSHPLCHCHQGFPGVGCWLAKSSLPDWTQFHMVTTRTSTYIA